jgi:hypothetical protein
MLRVTFIDMLSIVMLSALYAKCHVLLSCSV